MHAVGDNVLLLLIWVGNNKQAVWDSNKTADDVYVEFGEVLLGQF
jgi:hypothetical protein